MNLDDYFVMTIVTMLRGSADNVDAGLALLNDKQGIELTKPQAPRLRSLAVESGGKLTAFDAWARANRDSHARVAVIETASRPGLPAHIAAAFAGATTQVMVVRDKSYALHLTRSRSTKLDPKDLSALIDAQAHPEQARKAVAAHLTESNGMNNRPAVAAKELDAYLATPEGAGAFDFLASDFIRELQLEARNSGATFVIPEKLKDRFEDRSRYSDFFGGLSSDDQLELTGDVTHDDLASIFDAQTCRDAVWAAVRAKLTEIGHSPELRELELESLGFEHRMYLGEMQRVCKEAGCEVVRPAALADRLGTFVEHMSPEDRARYLPDSERLSLASNEDGWECWVLVDCGAAPANTDAPPLKGAVALLGRELEAIHAFAIKIESPFAQAFDLARRVLRDDLKDLNERQQSVLADKKALLADFEALGMKPEIVRALLAADIANVFGGMGSWNDIGFDGEDGITHERLSGQLFAAISDVRRAAFA